MVERYVRDVEVACSNHVTPICLMNVLESLKTRTPAFFFFVFILLVSYEKKVYSVYKDNKLDYNEQ